MTVSEALGAFITSTEFGDLSAGQVTAAKNAISDCHGCMIAGSATATATIVRRVAEVSSARGASTVIGGMAALSAQAAALANGTAAHALDYDDILWTQYGHPSATVWAAALAVCEAVGGSGQDVILAYAIGVQINGKLGRLVNPAQYAHGWHATATVGVIGSTAAACKLMGLTPEQTAMALGVAASEACGVRRNFGTMTKPFHAGNAARGAVLAAELAREGFTSDLTAFEGEFGWARTLNARTVPSALELGVQLRSGWELEQPGIVFKRYPACGATHCALDAIIAIKNENQLATDEMEKIICDASPFAKTVLLYPRPDTGLEGKSWSSASPSLQSKARRDWLSTMTSGSKTRVCSQRSIVLSSGRALTWNPTCPPTPCLPKCMCMRAARSSAEKCLCHPGIRATR